MLNSHHHAAAASAAANMYPWYRDSMSQLGQGRRMDKFDIKKLSSKTDIKTVQNTLSTNKLLNYFKYRVRHKFATLLRVATTKIKWDVTKHPSVAEFMPQPVCTFVNIKIKNLCIFLSKFVPIHSKIQFCGSAANIKMENGYSNADCMLTALDYAQNKVGRNDFKIDKIKTSSKNRLNRHKFSFRGKPICEEVNLINTCKS